MRQIPHLHCDIFCTVVDNHGDLGVCWRLARQLANEHGLAVRLWVDDLASFRKLCPDVVASQPVQHSHGVEIRHWGIPFAEVTPAQTLALQAEMPRVRAWSGICASTSGVRT
mgnify:CR=1 FL=1